VTIRLACGCRCCLDWGDLLVHVVAWFFQMSSHFSIKLAKLLLSAAVCRYWLRFVIGTWFELPLYTIRTQRYDLTCITLLGETAYWVVLALLWKVHEGLTAWDQLAQSSSSPALGCMSASPPGTLEISITPTLCRVHTCAAQLCGYSVDPRSALPGVNIPAAIRQLVSLWVREPCVVEPPSLHRH
jgi:hypothetical protein